MRILVVDQLYPGFLAWLYRSRPNLNGDSFAVQREAIEGALFSEVPFQVAALRRNGHDAEYHWRNAADLNEAWAREAGVTMARPRRATIVLRRGWVPWVKRGSAPGASDVALIERVKAFEPDVVHVQCVDSLRPEAVVQLKRHSRLVTGQIAAPIPDWVRLDAYDLVISSLPNYVEAFRTTGVKAEWLPLAFAPEIVDRIGSPSRDVDVSFVGSLSTAHRARISLLASVCECVPVDVWSADMTSPRGGRKLGSCQPHGPAWGAEMYRVLARSRISINSHLDLAGGYANNLRLYEATGMGTLLLTERSRNLRDLFVDGAEVATYADDRDCCEVIKYYIKHPEEARRIAVAGQERTIREHSWDRRMPQLVELFSALIGRST